MNRTLSRVKISQEQEQKISGYIIRQNFALRKDLSLPDLPRVEEEIKAGGAEKEKQEAGSMKQGNKNYCKNQKNQALTGGFWFGNISIAKTTHPGLARGTVGFYFAKNGN